VEKRKKELSKGKVVSIKITKLLVTIYKLTVINLQVQSSHLPRVSLPVRSWPSHWSPAGPCVLVKLRVRWKLPCAANAVSSARRCWNTWTWVAKWSGGWTGSGKTRTEVPPVKASSLGSYRTVTVITTYTVVGVVGGVCFCWGLFIARSEL